MSRIQLLPFLSLHNNLAFLFIIVAEYHGSEPKHIAKMREFLYPITIDCMPMVGSVGGQDSGRINVY
jgi:hypothetical protein